MITEQELLEAIAECQGQRNPNANTCIKLASYYTIYDHIKKKDDYIEREEPMYSFSAPPVERKYQSDTEFGRKIRDMDAYEVLAVMDELMTTLTILNPRLYEGVMSKL